MLLFYGHLCAQSRLNGPSDLQRQWRKVIDETPFWCSLVGVWTDVLYLCEANRATI